MKLMRKGLASLFSFVLTVAAYAAEKGGDKAEVPIEQASSGVVIGFLVFCVVGIAAWIFYTSRASKKEQGKE